MNDFSPLCSGLILLKTPLDEIPTIIEKWPGDFSLGKEEQEFKASVNIHHNTTPTFIFMFNTSSYACVSLHFQFNTLSYVLVILSKHPFYFFYKNMLRVATQTFLVDDIDSTPINRFYFLCTAIASFPEKVPKSITVSFPSTEYDYAFSDDSYTYSNFDPSVYFTVNEIHEIWHHLFMGDPILILTQDPFAGSTSVLSCLRLLMPLRYLDNKCLWLTETDPRFVDVINGESDIKIAATNCTFLPEATDHFKYVINLNNKRYESRFEAVFTLYKKMKRILLFTNYEIDCIITEEDPYCDIIQGEILTRHFIAELNYHAKYDLSTAEEIRGWEQTISFKKWRGERNSFDKFREGILNVDPEPFFQKKSKEELEKIYKVLGDLIKSFSTDLHAKVVLQRHKKILSNILHKGKKINEVQIQNSQ